jgi:pyruvate,water dikinase
MEAQQAGNQGGVIDRRDPAEVGYKFSRLEEMRLAGLPVPAFVCLPAGAFDQALAKVRPEADDAAEWCAAAHAALTSAAIPADIAETIDGMLRTEFDDDATFAVRTCAVPSPDGTGEDSAGDPFAGMSDSFLYVRRDQVLGRVAACWASAFTERAVRYRLWRGQDPRLARVAVGIQEMVLGARSFVAFTRDPRNSLRQAVIAAAHGIGTGVVAEEADIDHYFVDGAGVRVEAVRKHRMAGPDGVVAVPPELADVPVLTVPEARKIANLSARVEALFGCPQDIEGTITADGTVFVVQARPMTPGRRKHNGRLYWSNHNITESFPGVSCVLTYSQAHEFYRRAFGDLYRRLGVPKRRFDSRKHHLEQMVAFLDGRIYYRMDAWQALHGLLPVFELLRPGWEAAMGITGSARGRQQRSKFRELRAVPGLLARMTRHPAQVREFLRWWDGLYQRAGDLCGLTPEELISTYRKMWAQVDVRWGVTLTNSVYLSLLADTTSTLLRRWAGADHSLLTGLLTGGRENRSLAAARAAIGLAEQLAADTELSTAIQCDSSKHVWQQIQDGRYGARPADAIHHYLHRYGDRSPHDLKLEEATPRQRPWMVLDIVRPYLEQDLTVADNRARERRTAAQARQRLAAQCPRRWRRSVLRLLAAGLRETIRFREDTRFCRSQLYGLSREVMWRLGHELARAGLLESPLDILDLTVQEVLGAFDGTLPGTDLRGLAAHRHAEREHYRCVPARHTLIATEPDLPLSIALPAASPVWDRAREEALRGLGSSPGVVQGPARIVLGLPADAEQCRGSILIARETDPGWLFVMMAARGLVVERGTLLSHTAITGRLLGIPTVVAVPDATRRIPDGALIEIDGDAGTIRILRGSA